MFHEEVTTARATEVHYCTVLNFRKPKAQQPLRLFLKEWRKFRGYSQERLAEMIGTTKATVSRIENSKQNWDQQFLQLAADALQCTPGDLMMRNPLDPEGLWSIYDQLQPIERRQAVEIIKTIKRTGTDG